MSSEIFYELPEGSVISSRQFKRSFHQLACSSTLQNLLIPAKIKSLVLQGDGASTIFFGFSDSPNEQFILLPTSSPLVLPSEFFLGQSETILYYRCSSGSGTLYLILLTESM